MQDQSRFWIVTIRHPFWGDDEFLAQAEGSRFSRLQSDVVQAIFLWPAFALYYVDNAINRAFPSFGSSQGVCAVLRSQFGVFENNGCGRRAC
jgi:hypothetical protein